MTPRLGLTDSLPQKQVSKRGRPSRDPIESLRARIWYWHVKFAVDASDYALNQRFRNDIREDLRNTPAPKVFERIRSVGIVPKDNSSNGLIARVEKDPAFRGTASIFRSVFWRLLAKPDQNVVTLKKLIEIQSFKINRFRPNHAEAWSKQKAKGYEFVIGDMAFYAESISKLGCIGTFESAALLGLLYKEAFMFGQLDQAIVLRDAFKGTMISIDHSMRAFLTRPYISQHRKFLENDISELVNRAIDRVIYTAYEDSDIGDLTETQYPWF